ncbi:MAG: flagellar hook-basal body protein [Lachnospiraceae bacterium]|nr:flagellar hook-basal body protein [Lachnospiraceae bacterium]
MIRGLYTAWTGMVNEQKRLDVLSNNLANSATVGYKKEGATSQSFDEVLTIRAKNQEPRGGGAIGQMSLGVKIGEVYTDYGQGAVRETGNPFDLALEGDGFFTIEYTDRYGRNTTRYTRNGEFNMTRDGYITTADGQHLLGQSGWLQVPVDAGSIAIDTEGRVFADGEEIDQLRLADFENYDYLKKFGETMYMPVQGATEKDADCRVLQGYTEQSNVNVINEMVSLITITRAYEANQRVVRAMDSLLEADVNSVGRVQ